MELASFASGDTQIEPVYIRDSGAPRLQVHRWMCKPRIAEIEDDPAPAEPAPCPGRHCCAASSVAKPTWRTIADLADPGEARHRWLAQGRSSARRLIAIAAAQAFAFAVPRRYPLRRPRDNL